MTLCLKDALTSEYVLRILTGMSELTVKAVRTQKRLAKLVSHDAILDVFAEDETGRLYNIEIQREDTVDHARRTRFYGAMIDSEMLEKGKTYAELPDVFIIYISEKDIWKAGLTSYPVEKGFRGTGISYEDGMHVLYVNAAVDDGTETARLMRFFKNTDPADQSHGALLERVRYLKCEEGGKEEMCEITEKIYMEGKVEGKTEQAISTANQMHRRGFDNRAIAEILEVSVQKVQEWLSGSGINMAQ